VGVAGGLGEGLWALRVLAARAGGLGTSEGGRGGGSGGREGSARGGVAARARAGRGGGGGGGAGGGSPGPGEEDALALFWRSDVPKKLADVVLLIALARLGTYVPISGR